MRPMRFVFVAAICALVPAGLAAQSFEKVPEARQQTQQQAPAQPAQGGVSGKIGVLNVQQALLGTQEGQKALQELQERFRPQQTELETLRQEVEERQKRLQDGGRTLSLDVQQEIQREINLRVKKGQRLEEDLNDEMQFAQSEVINRISEKMRPIINQYAQEKSMILIIPVNPQNPQGMVPVYMAPGVNITADIIRLYDQAHPVQQASAGSNPGN